MAFKVKEKINLSAQWVVEAKESELCLHMYTLWKCVYFTQVLSPIRILPFKWDITIFLEDGLH